ncbi:MAG: toll/interleukin-1 receptor domain-containing protein [Terriglobales bacterium]
MDIFISWSGPRSRAVAEALKEYLPIIVNDFNPWLSSADIDKGARWSSDLSAALATAKAGIICLTPNNLTAPYILFESGAISKTVDKPFVCTLLIGIEPSDVSGPLAQFQATKPTKDDLLQLLKTLNKALGASAIKEAQVHATFELVWPKLQEKLGSLPSDGPTGRPHRPEREVLEELVSWVRSTSDGEAALVTQVMEHMDRIADRLASIEATTSLFDHYIYETAKRKVEQSSGLNSANSYADLLGKSDVKKIVDEALSKGDLASAYGAAAKVLSGKAPSLPIRNRRAATKARARKETT